MLSKFVQLHVHSEYSLDCGMFKVRDYIAFALKNKIPVLVLTDKFNLSSTVLFYNLSLKYGIKPIIGCEVLLEDDYYKHSKMLLLCKNFNGYQNLVRLITKSYLENIINDMPIIKRKWLIGLADDLIVIGLSVFSDIGKRLLDNKLDAAMELLDFWTCVFKDRYYLSVTRMNLRSEEKYIQLVLDISVKKNIALVVTNEVCFLCKEDYLVYRAKTFICEADISSSFKVDSFGAKESYYKVGSEINSIFSDIPQAVENSIEISKKCNIIIDFDTTCVPRFYAKTDLSSRKYLCVVAFKGLMKRLNRSNKLDKIFYLKRLKSELDIIISVEFEDYFLITYDFVNWAIKNNIVIGPGRGSGGGSLVAYSLFITNIDPISYDLLFERFLNIDRLSHPDFDIDFCIEGRDFVIDYIVERYGFFCTAQIITFGSMTIKAVIRDIGRVLGYSYGFVDNVAKLLSNVIGISLDSELKHNKVLIREYNYSSDIQVIIDFSSNLEKVIRNIGKHAGGIVISLYDLTAYVPLYFAEEECQLITQFDKIELEAFGLIKFDFLGLKTLTIIDTIVETLNAFEVFIDCEIFDVDNVFLLDLDTYMLLQKSLSIGVFQLESNGIKKIMLRLKPDRFADIVALVALYRPGPLQSGMLDDFINRKLGYKYIDYIHNKLKPILEETYGIIVYQEQIMQIAQRLAGYTLGSADLLRVAMSKKKNIGMFNNSTKFINGVVERGITREKGERVFNLIEKFAGYGFNKSHSVGYSLLSYQTAWLKSNCSIMFLSALLSSDMNNIDKLFIYAEDCKNFNIKIKTPDINRSINTFSIGCFNTILYGFGAVKNIGESISIYIIDDRNKNGCYNEFFDFIKRMDLRIITKQILLVLVYSGVFDKLSKSRSFLVCIVNMVFGCSELSQWEQLFDIDFFGESSISLENNYSYETSVIELKKEQNLLSIFASCHPVQLYEHECNRFKFFNNENLKCSKIIHGVIIKIRFIGTRKNKKVLVILDDLYYLKELMLTYSIYVKNRKLIKRGEFVIIVCKFYNKVLSVIFIGYIYVFRLKFTKILEIFLYSKFISVLFIQAIFECLFKNSVKGTCKIRLQFGFFNREGIDLDVKWAVCLNDDVINKLQKLKIVKYVNCYYNI